MSAAELIQVDFKERKVKSRRQLPEKGAAVGQWKALKDPNFKEFVKGIAVTAEAVHQYGGDWRRVVVVMCDQMPGQEEFCATIWDDGTIKGDDVMDILSASLVKVSNALMAEEDGSEPA